MSMPVGSVFAVVFAAAVVVGADVPVPRFARSEPVPGYPVVADVATGLIWQGCTAGLTGGACFGTASRFTWQAALDFCQDSTWAGFTDWYLPSINELASIVDDSLLLPSIDTTAFPTTPIEYGYWSSSSRAGGAYLALYVQFAGGGVHGEDKTAAYYVRCVRRGP